MNINNYEINEKCSGHGCYVTKAPTPLKYKYRGCP